jgi:hypothetical protein
LVVGFVQNTSIRLAPGGRKLKQDKEWSVGRQIYLKGIIKQMKMMEATIGEVGRQ